MPMAKAKKKPAKRKPITYRATGRYGILNHLGDLWTPETFPAEAAAQGYLDAQRELNPKWSLDRHKVVPVRVTVTATRA